MYVQLIKQHACHRSSARFSAIRGFNEHSDARYRDEAVRYRTLLSFVRWLVAAAGRRLL